MRISDWSSDVCSSDLLHIGAVIHLSGKNEQRSLSALRHLQRCEIGGGLIILQINAVFERLYTRPPQSRRFPEKRGLGLTNEQTDVGARSNLSFKPEQTVAFSTITPGHRPGAIAAVSSDFCRIHVHEIRPEEQTPEH